MSIGKLVFFILFNKGTSKKPDRIYFFFINLNRSILSRNLLITRKLLNYLNILIQVA